LLFRQGMPPQATYAKEVAQIGSAIGREFSHPLLTAVARKSEAELGCPAVSLQAGIDWEPIPTSALESRFSWRQESIMRWTPSIVPNGHDQTVYLILDDFGQQGRAYRETDVERTDLETVINDLMTGQYHNPITVVAFNLAERWANDVSEDIAREIQRRADLASEDLTSSIEDFVDRHAGRERQLALRLV
jgi:hypothetical protein